ncbi:hypothetical protein L596_022261 [Steinernema carpocapsae]|uniref:Uncharacterized protein n=1 Tax=Steinernema carpocapsae TaxID=34508 RepID=A0A4U5ML82_STECR|nr:hypothetical protein L596_022261 [Steinernema carpocapsae]
MKVLVTLVTLTNAVYPFRTRFQRQIDCPEDAQCDKYGKVSGLGVARMDAAPLGERLFELKIVIMLKI